MREELLLFPVIVLIVIAAIVFVMGFMDDASFAKPQNLYNVYVKQMWKFLLLDAVICTLNLVCWATCWFIANL